MGTPLLDAAGVCAFLLLGGLFGLAQAALSSLRDGHVAGLVERGPRGARVAALLADPERVARTVRIGTVLATVSAAALAAATLADDMVPELRDWGLNGAGARAGATAAVTLVVGYLALVLGELVPPRLDQRRAEACALVLAGPLDRVATLVAPLRWLLTRSSARSARPVDGEPRAPRDMISPEELREIVAAHAALTEDERRILGEVLSVGEVALREVMVPRTEVDFIDAAMPVTEAIIHVLGRPHTRYPVVRGSYDDVVGFVNIRDLLRPGLGPEATVGSLAREVPALPGTNRVLPALSHLRQVCAHLAIVVDEYGGTAGIVTVEDLVEELVGEISDEYDEAAAVTRRLAGGQLEVDGLLNLDDFAAETGLVLPEGPYETVAGYLVARLGHIAGLGEGVEIAGHRMEVCELDGRRVARIRLSAARAPAPPPAVAGVGPAGLTPVGPDGTGLQE